MKWDDAFTQLEAETLFPAAINRRKDAGHCVMCDEVTNAWAIPANGYVCGSACLDAWQVQSGLAVLASLRQSRLPLPATDL